MTTRRAKSRSTSQRILARIWMRTARLDLVAKIRGEVNHSSYNESSLLTFDLNSGRWIDGTGVETPSATTTSLAAAGRGRSEMPVGRCAACSMATSTMQHGHEHHGKYQHGNEQHGRYEGGQRRTRPCNKGEFQDVFLGFVFSKNPAEPGSVNLLSPLLAGFQPQVLPAKGKHGDRYLADP